MSVEDLSRTRFAHSPLTEVAESLHLLATGRLPSVHRAWFNTVRAGLGDVDMRLLLSVVPAQPSLADFFHAGLIDPGTTIEQQLQIVATLPSRDLARDLQAVWGGTDLPPALRQLVSEGPAVPLRLADELRRYWTVAVEPYWQKMRTVLEDDVSFRAMELARGGVATMVGELHPEVSIQGDMLQIDERATSEETSTGAGILLIPSIFVWPNVRVVAGGGAPARLTYPVRGVGNVWESDDSPSPEDGLCALLGRSRAAILNSLAVPHSTTELALKLKQSAPAVSQHLSVLRLSGFAVSWRSGRRVLYQRTALATDVIGACGTAVSSPGSDRPRGAHKLC